MATFMRLTNAADGQDILINLDQVRYIGEGDPDAPQTEIIFSDNQSVYVREKITDITEMDYAMAGRIRQGLGRGGVR